MYKEYLKEFRNDFKNLTTKYDAYTVLYDFVKMCAISIYNAFAKNEKMEQEYLTTIKKYDKETQQIIPRMFAKLVLTFESAREIIDIFSEFYEGGNFKNARLGQFFTPFNVSTLMGEVAVTSMKNVDEIIAEKGFVTMMEPSCGAGRYDTSFC